LSGDLSGSGGIRLFLQKFRNLYDNVGGITDVGFGEMMTNTMTGNNRVEDMSAMILKYPLMNGYWEEKIPQFEKISVPACVVASWTSPLHTHGTLDAFVNSYSPIYHGYCRGEPCVRPYTLETARVRYIGIFRFPYPVEFRYLEQFHNSPYYFIAKG
jgi:hypothetical protein